MVQFDGALILELTNIKSNTHSLQTTHPRPLGVFGLNEVFVKRDIPSTVINYVDFWDHKELLDSILVWCEKHAVRRPIVACSTLFNENIFEDNATVTKVLTELKEHIDITVAVGGPNNHFVFEDLKPDVMFLGRTLHMFEHWIDGLPLSNNCLHNEKGIPVYRPVGNEIVEMPIVSKLYDDYCLMPTDVLSFETRLGCKFNCTFCAFQYRDAKDTQDSTPESLYNFFTSAKEYGITNFSCVDDTFNEDDIKIKTLLSVVERLDYKPYIVGYTRFDILTHKPQQIEWLDKCGFHCHFFGTETFHPEASKRIRKRLNKEKAFNMFEYLKENYPHWWVQATYITGLPLEPVEHCIDTINEIRERKLVNSLAVVPLTITYLPSDDDHASLMAKDPARFGITVTARDANIGRGTHREYEGAATKEEEICFDWSHDHCDEKTATLIAEKMSSKNMRKGLTNKPAWNHLSEKARGNVTAKGHINNYIAKKKSQMLG